MHPNSLLRENARKQLGGNIFAQCWLMVMLAYLIFSLVYSAASSFFILGLVIYGPFIYGLATITLSLVRGKDKVEINDLFCGFTEGFAENLLLGLLMQVFIMLWSLLFIIPGIVKSYSYAMAFYIRHDDPTKGWQACIDESREMMDGYKMKLFLLDLSFIGWYLLGSFVCGIGALFVIPYHEMARANFYESLRAGEMTYAAPADNTTAQQ